MAEERSRRYTVIPSAELDSLLDGALAGIAADIEAKKSPFLRAVVLGGGYGRGEGGVWRTPEGDRLYNDLDLFVFSSRAGRDDAGELDRRFREISQKWESRLGIAVDFGPAKNIESLKTVSQTLMFQELLRGWKPVWGDAEPEKWIPALSPEELPFTEAVRLLLNRGMGLIFAGEYIRRGTPDPDFIVRNMNKALLGGGDALLIAGGDYRWLGEERVKGFADYVRRSGMPEKFAEAYEEAFRRKLSPMPVMPEDPEMQWRRCRAFFLDALRRVAGVAEGASRRETVSKLSDRAAKQRSFKNMLRWARRTGKLRLPSEMFDAPVVTVLGEVYGKLTESEELPVCPPGLLRRWKAFN